MKTGNQGIDLIKRFEGFSAVPYRDAAGLWTIGFGHLIRKDENFTIISETEADELLQRDITAAEWGVLRNIRVPLSQHQFDALVSFTFNLGAGTLQRSTLRLCVNREEHDVIPQELLRWVWAGGRKLRGLYKRRFLEGELYRLS